MHPDQRVVPINTIPKGKDVINVSNTGNILKDGYYYDLDTEEYFNYVTEDYTK